MKKKLPASTKRSGNRTTAWKPGQSGNPAGRPRVFSAARLLAQDHTERAIKVLVEALDSPDERVRVTAANSLLDRGHGKPSGIDEEAVIREELERLADDKLQAIASPIAPIDSDEAD